MADSEVRQKFEAWLKSVGWEILGGDMRIVSEGAFEAGMRAGEIARWIPVEEKLPRPNQLVLACYAADKMAVTWHTGETWVPITHEMPTHWQRLPAAPEEKK